MKELKTKSYREVKEWGSMIDRFNGKGNLIPHEGMVSKNRGNMFSNASTQYRPCESGEVPIVDTLYSMIYLSLLRIDLLIMIMYFVNLLRSILVECIVV